MGGSGEAAGCDIAASGSHGRAGAGAAPNNESEALLPRYERPRGDPGSLKSRMADAHGIYDLIWDLENIVTDAGARRCVAHYSELWCLHQAPVLLGCMALASAATNGGLVRTRESSLSSLSLGSILLQKNMEAALR